MQVIGWKLVVIDWFEISLLRSFVEINSRQKRETHALFAYKVINKKR